MATERPVESDKTTYARGFFVELPKEKLLLLAAGKTRPEAIRAVLSPETCDYLAERGWGVSLATIDLDPPTAAVVREINANFPHLPIVLWVVLPDKQGYWTNETNIAATRQRVKGVINWVNDHNLFINGLGFDIEPPISFAQEMARGLPAAVRVVVKRYLHLREMRKRPGTPEERLSEIVSDLHQQNIRTEGYILPNPVYGRFTPRLTNVGTTLYTMVYTSFVPRALRRVLLEHGRVKGSYPAFGDVSSTGIDSGRDTGAKPRLLGEAGLIDDMNTMAQIGQEGSFDPLKRFRVFALTSLQVAQWTDKALKAAEAGLFK